MDCCTIGQTEMNIFIYILVIVITLRTSYERLGTIFVVVVIVGITVMIIFVSTYMLNKVIIRIIIVIIAVVITIIIVRSCMTIVVIVIIITSDVAIIIPIGFKLSTISSLRYRFCIPVSNSETAMLCIRSHIRFFSY